MMEYFIEQGTDYKDCLSRIVAKYGPDVIIMRKRNIRRGGILGFFTREGTEIEFYIPPVLNRNVSGYKPYQQPASGGNVPAPVRNSGAAAPLDFEEEKKKILASTGKDPSATQVILDEVREIKKQLAAGEGKKDEHPSLVRLGEILKENDFSDSYIKAMIEKARKELSLESLDNFDEVQSRTLEWIGESINVYREPTALRHCRIIALVGPTGVGKTTTIAKLAAAYGIENSGKPPLSVRLISIDAFRIGARAQIEAYGSIMGFPVSYIDNHRDLKKEIALYEEETDIILVDTIGKSPKDAAKLGEMKEVLNACGSHAEVYLALSASTKTSDLREILRQFEPFDYRAVVLTKLDETSHVGNVISILAEKGKPVSYITNGQKVPDDIKKANVIQFLINLDDFKVDRDKIEKRFSSDDEDKFEWS